MVYLLVERTFFSFSPFSSPSLSPFSLFLAALLFQDRSEHLTRDEERADSEYSEEGENCFSHRFSTKFIRFSCFPSFFFLPVRVGPFLLYSVLGTSGVRRKGERKRERERWGALLSAT